MELEYHCYDVISFEDPNEAIDVGEWAICGVGRLERIYSVCFMVKPNRG